MKTLAAKLLYVYTLTYAPQDLDRVKQTYRGRRVPAFFGLNDDADMRYVGSPLTMITSFLGLPNRNRGKGQSFTNIVKNIVGWKDASHPAYDPLRAKRIGLNLLRIVPYTGFNLARAALITAVNTFKIATELLPTSLMAVSDAAAGKLVPYKNHSKNRFVKGLAKAGFKVAEGSRSFFLGVGNLLRWLTSPETAMRRAHQDSKKRTGVQDIKAEIRIAKSNIHDYEKQKENEQHYAAQKAENSLSDDERIKIQDALEASLNKIDNKITKEETNIKKLKGELKPAKQAAVARTIGKAALRSPLLIVTAPVSVPLWNISMAAEKINPNSFFSKKPAVETVEPKSTNKKKLGK